MMQALKPRISRAVVCTNELNQVVQLPRDATRMDWMWTCVGAVIGYGVTPSHAYEQWAKKDKDAAARQKLIEAKQERRNDWQSADAAEAAVRSERFEQLKKFVHASNQKMSGLLTMLKQ